MNELLGAGGNPSTILNFEFKNFYIYLYIMKNNN